jgi:hypothetical protein
MNADPPKSLILLQLRNSPQMCKSTRKATKGVSTSIDVLYPDRCLLNHQLLQLWRPLIHSRLVLLHHCGKWEDAPHQKREEPDIKMNNPRIISTAQM